MVLVPERPGPSRRHLNRRRASSRFDGREDMNSSERRVARVSLYVGAIVITLIALAVALVVQRVSATPSYAVFVAAVAIAARYGGKGPAFVSSVLSLVLIDYFLI